MASLLPVLDSAQRKSLVLDSSDDYNRLWIYCQPLYRLKCAKHISRLSDNLHTTLGRSFPLWAAAFLALCSADLGLPASDLDRAMLASIGWGFHALGAANPLNGEGFPLLWATRPFNAADILARCSGLFFIPERCDGIPFNGDSFPAHENLPSPLCLL